MLSYDVVEDGECLARNSLFTLVLKKNYKLCDKALARGHVGLVVASDGLANSAEFDFLVGQSVISVFCPVDGIT